MGNQVITTQPSGDNLSLIFKGDWFFFSIRRYIYVTGMKTVVFFLLCLVSVLGQFHDWVSGNHGNTVQY